MLVLDEADKLLDIGFKDTVDRILRMLPKQRRTGLFSATQTKGLKDIARAGMRNPVSITVEINSESSRLMSTIEQTQSQSTGLLIPSTLKNWYMKAEYDQRMAILVKFFNYHCAEKIIVFVSTCACVDYFSSVFQAMISTESSILNLALKFIGFHGKLSPKIRNRAYRRFMESCSGVMITTDVAARGIDIPDVDWVVQFSAPKDPAFFVHRVGRTARAGREGSSLLLISEEENSYVEFLKGRGVVFSETCMEFPDRNLSVSSDYLEKDILRQIQCLLKRDRDLLEASSKAFISFLRAYKEHQCAYIFRFDRLNLGSIARCYAILKLPKISETKYLKHLGNIDFEPTNIDTSAIPYLQEDKERLRQAIITGKNAQYVNEGNGKMFRTHDEKPFSRGDIRHNDFPEKNNRNKKKRSSLQTLIAEWDEIANGDVTIEFIFFVAFYLLMK